MEAHSLSPYREPKHLNGEDCQRPCGEHALVGGAYPNEFKYSCQWCGDAEDETCRYCYFSERPFETGKCEICGHCDCSANGKGEPAAILCQLVDECMGLAYDLVYDAIKGGVICLNCWEIAPKPVINY